MRQSFCIQGTLSGLNEYTKACRASAQCGGGVKRKNQRRVAEAIRDASLRPMQSPVDVTVYWIERNMRRDKDNIRFGIKFILDALVSEGIITDDSWRHVRRLQDEYWVNRNKPRVIVIVDEVKGAKK